MDYGRYGHEALLGDIPPGLVPRLVGLLPHGRHTTPYEHPEEPPFVLLTGPDRSALLGEVGAAYRGHTPLALTDCVSAPSVARALTEIAEQLAEPVGGAGRIGFPRLAAGLLAVAMGGWSAGGTTAARIGAEAERILALGGPGAGGRGRIAVRLLTALASTGPFVEPMIEAALEAFCEGVSPAQRRLRRAAAWYRDYPGAGGSPKLGLVLLAGDVRSRTPRKRAELLLVRAMLADLDDAYAAPLYRSPRPGRPLVLIDNAQQAPALIAAVLRERANGRTDQVAFFASLPDTDHPALRDAARRTLTEVARDSGWEPRKTAASRALLLATG